MDLIVVSVEVRVRACEDWVGRGRVDNRVRGVWRSKEPVGISLPTFKGQFMTWIYDINLSDLLEPIHFHRISDTKKRSTREIQMYVQLDQGSQTRLWKVLERLQSKSGLRCCSGTPGLIRPRRRASEAFHLKRNLC